MNNSVYSGLIYNGVEIFTAFLIYPHQKWDVRNAGRAEDKSTKMNTSFSFFFSEERK